MPQIRVLLQDGSFYALLERYDDDLAAQAREGGCGCGGRLHRALYPRKPRGPRELGEGYDRRWSFCCAEEGCRRRTTPPSVRFLGRRVYLAVVVLLASAMQHGETEARTSRLRAELGVTRRTLGRWRRWWREVFPTTALWRGARGQLYQVREEELPASLLDGFATPGRDARTAVMQVLRLLLPLTTSSPERSHAW